MGKGSGSALHCVAMFRPPSIKGGETSRDRVLKSPKRREWVKRAKEKMLTTKPATAETRLENRTIG
jgi:hypothetical protein